MARISPKFESSDCWILLSIVYHHAAGASRMADILPIADWINHAIPTAEELDGALNRLLAAEYITRVGDAFAATEVALDAVASVSTPRRWVLDIWDDLHRMLTCPRCGPKLKSVRRQVKVTKKDLEAAYAEYTRQLRPKRRR